MHHGDTGAAGVACCSKLANVDVAAGVVVLLVASLRIDIHPLHPLRGSICRIMLSKPAEPAADALLKPTISVSAGAGAGSHLLI